MAIEAPDGSPVVPEYKAPKLNPWKFIRRGLNQEFTPEVARPGNARAELGLRDEKDAWKEVARTALRSEVIRDRLAIADPIVLQELPTEVLGLVVASVSDPNMDNETVKNQLRFWNSYVPWVADRDKFAGVPGVLTQARRYAKATGDREIMVVLDKLQTLPPMQQSLALDHFRNLQESVANIDPMDDSKRSQLMAEAMQGFVDALGLTATFGTAMGPEGLETTGGWSMDVADPDAVDVMVGLRRLLPQLGYNVRIGVSEDDEFITDPANTLIEGAGSLVQLSGQAFMTGLQAAEWVAGSGRVQLEKLLGEDDPKALDRARRESQVLMQGINENVVMAPFKLVDMVTRPVATGIINNMPGLDEENRQNAVEIVNAILQVIVFKGVREGGRAWKTASGMPEELARVELGIDQPISETNYGRGVLGRRGVESAVNSPIAHPVRFGLDAMRRAVVNFRGRTLDEAVRSHPDIIELFDKAQEVKATLPKEEQFGALSRHYGGQLPPDLIQALLDAPRPDMPRTFYDFFNRPKEYRTRRTETNTELKRTRKRVGDLQGQLKSLNSQLDTLVRERNARNQRLGAVDNPDPLQQRIAEVRARLNELEHPDRVNERDAATKPGVDEGGIAISIKDRGPAAMDDAISAINTEAEVALLKREFSDLTGEAYVHPEADGPRGVQEGPVTESGVLQRDQVVYRGEPVEGAVKNDMTKHWYRSRFVTWDKRVAEAYAKLSGKMTTWHIRKGTRVLVEGTAEFERVRQASFSNHVKGNKSLDDLYLEAQRQGYDVIQMIDQDGLGTAVINESVLERVPDGAKPDEPLSDGEAYAGEAVDRAVDPTAELETMKDLARQIDETNRSIPLEEARIQSLEYQVDMLLRAGRTSPMLDFWPKANTLRAASLQPISRSEKFISKWFVKPLRSIGADPYKWVDELPDQPVLYNPTAPGRPIEWFEHNSDVVAKYLRRSGVPDNIVNRAVSDMWELRNGTHQDFYTWAETVADTIDRHLPESTPVDVRQALTRWWTGDLEGKTNSIISDRVTWSDGSQSSEAGYVLSVEDANGGRLALPSRPSEFVGNITLPSVDFAIEATSWVRRLGRTKGGKYPLSAMRFILKANTAVWKAPILALRIPAMAMRIQLEQAMRARMYGEYHPITLTPGGTPMTVSQTGLLIEQMMKQSDYHPRNWTDARYSSFSAAEDMPLGSIYNQLADDYLSTKRITMSTDRLRQGKAPIRSYHYDGWADMIKNARADALDRALASHNLDVQAILDDIEAGRFDPAYVEAQTAVLERAWGDLGLSRTEMWQRLLERRAEHIRHITKNDPILLEGIGSGRIRPPRGIPSLSGVMDPSGVPVSERYANLEAVLYETNARLGDLREAYHGGRATPEEIDTIRVLDEVRRQTLTDMRALEKQYGELRKYRGYDTSNLDSISGYLRGRIEAGQLDWPDQINIKTRYTPEESAGVLGALRKMRDSWNTAWYRPYKMLTWTDLKGTRGSMYYQAADRYYRKAITLGYDESFARGVAQNKAAALVRDVMYDLTARTSMHRAVKDLFWFAPATQEVMYTWLWKVPSQSYPVIGHIAMVGEVKALVDLFSAVNIIQEDPATGEMVVPIPGLSTFINSTTGLKVPDYNTMKVRGFNLALSSPIPALSVIPAALLGKASRTLGGPFKTIGDIFLPYGPDVTAWPQQIIYAYETLTGERWPAEFLSPGYQKWRYDRAYDASLQYAYQDLTDRGILPPKPEDFADQTSDLTGRPSLSVEAEERFFAAQDAYMNTLTGTADDYFRGAAFVSFLGSTVSPASIRSTTKERNFWQTFWNDTIKPLDDGKNEGLTEQQKELINKYISDHPGSLAYYTYYSTVTGAPMPEGEPTDPDDFFGEYAEGLRRVMDPEEYSRRLQLMSSYRYYTSSLDSRLREISPDLKASELLYNAHERSQALSNFREEWDRYLALNPQLEADMKRTRRDFATAYGLPERSYESERLAETIDLLTQASSLFTGEGGNRLPDYRKVMSQLKALYSEEGEFGEPNTRTERQMNWWFENVLSPYMDETGALYEEATQYQEAGMDSSAIWDRLRAINESQENLTHNGETFPTPEEFFFATKPEPEQEYARINWATKPVTWLTEFQMGEVGYLEFEGRSELVQSLREFDDSFYQALEDRKVAPSSTLRDQYDQWAEAERYRIASEYGQPGVNLYQLAYSAPYVRLDATGFNAENNPSWTQVTTWVSSITKQLQQEGVSPKGYSELALKYKVWLYGQIGALQQSDPAFAAMLDQMSYAIPDAPLNRRTGVPLYEAIFFGQFNTDYLPVELVGGSE